MSISLEGQVSVVRGGGFKTSLPFFVFSRSFSNLNGRDFIAVRDSGGCFMDQAGQFMDSGGGWFEIDGGNHLYCRRSEVAVS